MTIQEFLQTTTNALKNAGIDSAHLDCLLLLEDALGRDRASLLAHPDDVVPTVALATLNTQVTHRITHLPLAYIRGRTAFYGRNFVVTLDVLVPRPETEAMVQLLLEIPLHARPHIADVGTGSGCLAITAALEIPGSVVDAYDISQAALAVAKQNAAKHRTSIHCHEGNLLERPARPHHVVLANLPYVPDSYPINKAARHEPHLALFAGQDGMQVYRLLWQQLSEVTAAPRHVITEAFPSQHLDLACLAKSAGYSLQSTAGYAQLFMRN